MLNTDPLGNECRNGFYASWSKMMKVHSLIFESNTSKESFIDTLSALQSIEEGDSDNEQSYNEWDMISTKINSS